MEKDHWQGHTMRRVEWGNRHGKINMHCWSNSAKRWGSTFQNMHFIVRSRLKKTSSDLLGLLQAEKYALKRNLKTQILSHNACRYPLERLQKLHVSFECIIMWQIKRTRVHVSWPRPRCTLAIALVNHFTELYTFLNSLIGFHYLYITTYVETFFKRN